MTPTNKTYILDPQIPANQKQEYRALGDVTASYDADAAAESASSQQTLDAKMAERGFIPKPA